MHTHHTFFHQHKHIVDLCEFWLGIETEGHVFGKSLFSMLNFRSRKLVSSRSKNKEVISLNQANSRRKVLNFRHYCLKSIRNSPKSQKKQGCT
jgi:hypothetical protein